MPAVRVTAPGPLVSLDTVKAALRIDHDDEDDYLSAIVIPTAVDEVERFTGRALLSQRWRLTLDRWPAVILFPRPPLLAVVSVSYRRPDGTMATLDPAAVIVDADSLPGRAAPVSRTCWPEIDGGLSPIAILFDAGTTDAAAVPRVFVSAVLATAGHLYVNRETAAGLPDGVKKDLAAKRVRWFGDSP